MNNTPYNPNRPYRPYSWLPPNLISPQQLSGLPGYQPPPVPASPGSNPQHGPYSLANNHHQYAFPAQNANQAFNPPPYNRVLAPAPRMMFNAQPGTHPPAFQQTPYQAHHAYTAQSSTQPPGLSSRAFPPYTAVNYGPPAQSGNPAGPSRIAHLQPGTPSFYINQEPVRVQTNDSRSSIAPQTPLNQAAEIGHENASSQDGPGTLPAETSDEDDMSVDEGESQAVAQAMIAGGLDPSSTSRKRGRPPRKSTEQPTKKRRKKRTGKRGGWSKGMRMGPRPVLEPSPEFNDLHQNALNAFIDEQDTEKARDLILQAITINPEIYAAHALLSEIYFARREDEKAIAALFSGAHSAARDAEVWRQVADACLQHSSKNRQSALQQVSYCYARIISNDNRDYDTRLDRAAISKEIANYGKAMKDLDICLAALPWNAKAMKLIAEVGIATKNRTRAKSLYADCFAQAKDSGEEGKEIFTWAHAIAYVDLLSHDDPPNEARSNAILVFRQVSRWILGRDDESYWDDFDDDREWDAEDEPRRVMVPQFIPDVYPIESYGSGLPLELRVQLGVLRLKQGSDHLAEAIDHLEWLEPEARDEGASVYEYPDLFLEAANALYAAKEHEQALRYFEALRDIEASLDVDLWLAMAMCNYVIGDKAQAIECYEAAKEVDHECGEARTQLAKLYTDLEEKEKAMQNAREAVRIAEQATPLTEKRRYERKEQRLARKAAETALKQAYSLRGPLAQGPAIDRIESRLKPRKTREEIRAERTEKARALRLKKQKPPTKTVPESKPRPPPRKKPMTPAEKEAYRTEGVTRLYSTLLENVDGMRERDESSTETWTECAQALIMDFQSNRKFYPNDRMPFVGFENRPKSKKQTQVDDPTKAIAQIDIAEIPTTYREIPFINWLDVFLEYALVLARSGDQTRCYKTITAAIDCSVWYHDPNAQLLIYTTYLTCCIALRDEATVYSTVIRWFLRTYEFCTDAFRLFAAINLIFPYTTDKNGKEGQLANLAYRSSPMQKFLFRQIINLDVNLPEDYSPEGFGPVPDFMRRQRDKIPRDEKPPTASDLSPTKNKSASNNTIDGPENLRPKEMDVVLLTLYGHILYANGSFRSALSYFYRAHGLDPHNPVLLLTMALSYMHEMMKRQNENRHIYLLQGWAFFEEYADARRAAATASDEETDESDNGENTAETGVEAVEGPDKGKEQTNPKSKPVLAIIEAEIEFNRARCWHMLGMSDLAVRSYEKVLALQRGKAVMSNETRAVVDQVPEEDASGIGATQQQIPDKADIRPETYTMEAAYAIQTMYVMSGNPLMARAVTEKYLVV